MIDYDVEALLRRRHVKVPTRRPYVPRKRTWEERFFDVVSARRINYWLQRYYDFVFTLITGY